MRINTNIASLNAQDSAKNTNTKLGSSLDKLSSGLRINKAADDASGLSIADKLRTQASSIGQGISNANSASALIQIADKAMAEQGNILDTVKTKLIQASTSTTSAEGRESIRKDISKLLEQFDNIASQTNYNGTTLLQKDTNDQSNTDKFSFQLGEEAEFNVQMQATSASNTKAMGGGSESVISSTGTVGANGTGLQITESTATDLLVQTNGINLVGQDSVSMATNTTTTITLKSVVSGVEGQDMISTGTIANEKNTLDVTFSGNLGDSFDVTTTYGTTEIVTTNQSTETKNVLKAMADSSIELTYSSNAVTGEEKFILAATAAALDLTSVTFTEAKLVTNESTTANNNSAAVIEIKNTDGFTLTNNADDTVGSKKVDMFVVDTQTYAAGETSKGATGGELLSNLKNLAKDGLTASKANTFMATVDESISALNANRSDFGSTQNQIESSLRNMQTTQVNLKAAESVIRDVDYAQESANFNKQNIISQAGTYAMSQANSLQQNVMRLLQ